MMTPNQESSHVEQIVSERMHSAPLIKSIREWVEGIEWDRISDLQSLRSDWSESIQRVAAEGSFLGYWRVVRLCRAVQVALTESELAPSKLTPSQLTSLRAAVKTIANLVQTPQSETTALVFEAIGQLQAAFELRESEIEGPVIQTKFIPSSIEHSAKTTTTSGFGHRDLDVYRKDILDPLGQCFEEESWVVSQLASLAEDLARGSHSGHPAARLMHVLHGHRFFSQVDRVCLAGRVADANQLVIVDACTSERCCETTLRKGYSCFVNPNGSLFNMRPGNLRVFADSEQVLASFSQQNKPAQRSIALVADQGLRSGLCLAIGRGSVIQGFLFLNSVTKDLFKDISAGFAPLLSLFGLVATIGFDASGFHVGSQLNEMLRERLPDSVPKVTTIFVESEFGQHVEQTLSHIEGKATKWKTNVCFQRDRIPFLYLPSIVIGILCEWIHRIYRAPIIPESLSIFVFIEHGEVRIELEHKRDIDDVSECNWIKQTVDSMNARFINKPIRVGSRDSKVFIAFPFEPLPCHHNDLLYSTVY